MHIISHMQKNVVLIKDCLIIYFTFHASVSLSKWKSPAYGRPSAVKFPYITGTRT